MASFNRVDLLEAQAPAVTFDLPGNQRNRHTSVCDTSPRVPGKFNTLLVILSHDASVQLRPPQRMMNVAAAEGRQEEPGDQEVDLKETQEDISNNAPPPPHCFLFRCSIGIGSA